MASLTDQWDQIFTRSKFECTNDILYNKEFVSKRRIIPNDKKPLVNVVNVQ